MIREKKRDKKDRSLCVVMHCNKLYRVLHFNPAVIALSAFSFKFRSKSNRPVYAKRIKKTVARALSLRGKKTSVSLHS